RKLDRDGIAAAYPFGFGLGYTTFELRDLEIGPVNGERFAARVTLTNTGSRTGRHVVQVYAHLPGHDRLVRALVGFHSVSLQSGQTRQVTVECTTRPLQRWTGDRFVIDAAELIVEAASCAGDRGAVSAKLTCPSVTPPLMKVKPATARLG